MLSDKQIPMITSRLAAQRLEKFADRPVEWKRMARVAFAIYETFREDFRQGRCPGPEDRKMPSPEALRFGREIAENLGKAAAARRMKVNVLGPKAIDNVPGAATFSPIQSIAFGFERKDGKMVPLVFDRDRMLVPNGGKPRVFEYDENTDFRKILRETITPKSFM